MAASIIHGAKAKVSWNAGEVTTVLGWDFTYSADIIDATTLSTATAAKARLVGLKDWTCTVTMFADDAGASPAEGDEATLDLWLGTLITDGHISGNAIVSTFVVSQDPADYGKIVYTFQGNGAVTYAVI